MSTPPQTVPPDDPAQPRVEPTATDPTPTDPTPTDPTPTDPTPTDPTPAAAGGRTPWKRLLKAAFSRPSWPQLLLAALLFALGFGVVTQATQASDLSGLRQSDLVRLLDDVSERRSRAERDQDELTARLEALNSNTDKEAEARAAALEQRDTYSILAGTAQAVGPGVRLSVSDPDRNVPAVTLLDTVQELRDAGAEAIQIGDVRIVADTAFSQDGQQVLVSGQPLDAAYDILAIGDPDTMQTALSIPGGVYETITQTQEQGREATLTIVADPEVLITAVVPLDNPQFASPDDNSGG